MRITRLVLATVYILFAHNAFADFEQLTKSNYAKADGRKSVVVYGVNWGRQWGCARLDNAQLQGLVFSRMNSETGNMEGENITLKASVNLLAEDVSKPNAIIVTPGKYALVGFDIKVVKSSRDIGHIKVTSAELFEDGKPLGGTFEVGADEIVYIGDFGLDCSDQPTLWRYYIQKEDFDEFVLGFKKRYPFIADKDVLYRLFETEVFGQ